MQTFARNHCKYFFVKKGAIVDGSDFRQRPTPEIFLVKSCGVIFFEIFHKKVLTFSQNGSMIIFEGGRRSPKNYTTNHTNLSRRKLRKIKKNFFIPKCKKVLTMLLLDVIIITESEREVSVMMTRYEVWVFGQDLENLENEGGWQMCFASFNEQEARDFAIACEVAYGDDNVDLR